jgi:hypothetical protein
MLPTIGRIVHYTLDEHDAEAINRVVRTFGGTAANLQVFLDGNDAYWATSRVEGSERGNWVWAPRV